MGAESIMLALEVHQIPHYRSVDGVVWAFESATMRNDDGTTRDVSEWVRVPDTTHALAAWLGY
jgi:hypothetical protein